MQKIIFPNLPILRAAKRMLSLNFHSIISKYVFIYKKMLLGLYF